LQLINLQLGIVNTAINISFFDVSHQKPLDQLEVSSFIKAFVYTKQAVIASYSADQAVKIHKRGRHTGVGTVNRSVFSLVSKEAKYHDTCHSVPFDFSYNYPDRGTLNLPLHR